MKQQVRNEDDVVEVVGEGLFDGLAAAFVDDQPRLQLPLPKYPEEVERKGGLTSETQ